MRNNRTATESRTIKISHNVFDNADGSVLIEFGKTKVLCAVTLQDKVPHFLKGTKTGWLTAHYSMLPTSCQNRIEREIKTGKPNGRFVEISRLIGRCLRTVVNLDVLGEKTITIDCDVLQADGGTRTAAITGACLALKDAQERWLQEKKITQSLVKDDVAALSVGIKDGEILVDLDYLEDSTIDADFNFVMTRSGGIIEIQGTAEQAPVSMQQFNCMSLVAAHAIASLFSVLDAMDIKTSTSQLFHPSIQFHSREITQDERADK